jgi:hypothetical protein
MVLGLELYFSWSLDYSDVTENWASSTARVVFGRINREGDDWCIDRILELGGMFEGRISLLPRQHGKQHKSSS